MLFSLILTVLSSAPKIYLFEQDLQILPGELEGLWDDVDDPKDVSQSEYDPNYDSNLAGKTLQLSA
jgi:hypothetical protein